MIETQKAVESNKKFYLSWSLHDTDVRLEGIRIGEKRGEKRGKKQGKKQGINEAKIASARNMLEDNLPIEKISQYTGLPLEKIEELATDLAKEASLQEV